MAQSELALWRFSLIAPLLHRAPNVSLATMARQLAAEVKNSPEGAPVFLSAETLLRWLRRYQKGGLDALENQMRSDEGARARSTRIPSPSSLNLPASTLAGPSRPSTAACNSTSPAPSRSNLSIACSRAGGAWPQRRPSAAGLSASPAPMACRHDARPRGLWPRPQEAQVLPHRSPRRRLTRHHGQRLHPARQRLGPHARAP